jgi:hypothetical protein
MGGPPLPFREVDPLIFSPLPWEISWNQTHFERHLAGQLLVSGILGNG